MKILIEGEKYPIPILEEIFDDSKFYHQIKKDGIINSVGYYHSDKNREVIYMLPKVFMTNGDETVFGIPTDTLLNIEQNNTFKHDERYNWIRQISVYFYNSLLEFKKRKINSSIVQSSLTFELNTNIEEQEYSFLDLLLSFVNFYKKNKSNILFKHIEYKSNQVRNPKWDKTIRKRTPLLTKSKKPIYNVFRNKKKIVNTEEELLVYFFSILNHLNTEHTLYLKIDKSYTLITGNKFKQLQENGLFKLKKIKYRYFNDTLKRMYHLCEIYFSKSNKSSTRKKREEFISIKNYNLIFEDMVDKLFSDNILDKTTIDGISMKHLKNNDDGKIIDHIFDYRSLLDTSNIFYIGDSKYYKSDNVAGKVSRFKQFTYAKNVIQYNIDLLNKDPKEFYKPSIRYRDDLTEGYNITPNFFIYGYISNYKNFDYPEIEEKGEIVRSYHFEDRLFDRDTLFVHQYKINFLFVLKTYTHFGENKTEEFREKTKSIFRTNIVSFLKDYDKSHFKLYKFTGRDPKKFVTTHFREIIGKCFKTNNEELLLAVHKNDVNNGTLNHLLSNFEEYTIQ